MHKTKIACLLMLTSSFLFSQKNEIGASILAYSSIRDASKIGDTTSYSNQKSITSLQPVLTFNHITNKNVDVYIQAGYFYLPGNNTSKNGRGNTVQYSKGNSEKKSTYLKIGLAKRYYYENIVFAVGVNIPFEYQFRQYGHSSVYLYDHSNNLLALDETTDEKSPYYITGLNVHQSLYLKVFKTLYVGMDLNLGFQTTIINGNRKYYNMHTDYQDASNNYTQNLNIMYKHSMYNSLYFQPVFGIRYSFDQKGKK